MARSKKEAKSDQPKAAKDQQLSFDDTTQQLHTKLGEAALKEESTVKTTTEQQSEVASVKAETHASSRKPKQASSALNVQGKWAKIAAVAAGGFALLAIVISGFFSQYFKGKVMPNVSVAGITSTAKTPAELKSQLQKQTKDLKLTFQTDDKKFHPELKEVGYQVDINKTVQNAMDAKRKSGIGNRLAFWKRITVPAVVTINNTLLSQYVETNTPNLNKAPTDAQLQFDTSQATFEISAQANGSGPDVSRLQKQLIATGQRLQPASFKLKIVTKGPTITEAKLQPLLQPANNLVAKQVVLTGLGYTYKARPADIASWITPTPQANGTMKLIIDPAKIQSYVSSIGKKISSPPQDEKIVKDDTTGQQVVLQEGRDGTELADQDQLAKAIAESLKNGQDTTQIMNITTAAHKTVNMSAYDKWIEVDLSEQRTTAYEHATPVKTFVVATGTKGHETVTGEFAIWLKVRSQTMKGGSKATGDYYDIPNVEWVSYFYQDYALHGAWWRKVFGYPASHGCVNMTNDDAHWVYDWAPVGTKVIVHQ